VITEREVFGGRVRDGKELEVAGRRFDDGNSKGTIGVGDKLDIQRDCHDMLLPQLQRREPTWKVLSRIMNVFSPPKATKAPAVSAEEFAQILQVVVQARGTLVAIFHSTGWWTRSPARDTC
jgi:hypothetical protein